MVELNLLPDVKKEFLNAQRARRRTIALAILITIIAAAATVLFAFYVYGVQSVVLFAQTDDIKKKAAEVKGIEDINKYLTIQNQLANLSQLHDNKVNLSRLMDFLPTLNPAPPKNVSLSNLDVSTVNKTVTFKGTVKDYAALTTFKDTLVNSEYSIGSGSDATTTKLFSEVNIDSAAYETSGGTVSFAVTATYDENAFLQKNKNVTVKVPNIETTQSVVGTPQKLFGGGQ